MDLYFSRDFSTVEIYLAGILILVWIIEVLYQFLLLDRPYRFHKKAQSGKQQYLDQYPPVSVIVYAQNDAENLINFLPRILNQDYPEFEVIIVNDGSTDDSKDILTSLESQYKNLYHTYVPEEARNLSHKKLALTLGVKAAKHDILLFTNANCQPPGKEWLASMARNFTPETDVVLGYTATEAQGKASVACWYRSFDQLLFNLRFLAFALIKRPYMGVSSNMAYRKELFFKNKGFSKYLHLHYGDDDLFINEIATPHNTRIEISKSAQMTAFYDDNHTAWKEMKLQYGFTAKYLRTSSKWLSAASKLFDYVFDTLFILLLIKGILHNLSLAAIALVPAIALFVVKAIVYRRAAKTLRSPRLLFSLPVFSIAQPWVNLYFRIAGLASRKKNFTW